MKALEYSLKFYRENANFVLLFSIPFILAFLIPSLVSGPNYVALGGVFLRTGSIPEVEPVGAAITLIAYLVSMFIIAESIVNITLLIKTKRVQNNPSKELLAGMEKYGVTVFLAYTLAALLILVFQLLTFEMDYRTIVLPILMFLVSICIFFVPQAMVIDEYNLGQALDASVSMVRKKFPEVFLWMLIGTVLLTVSELVLFLLPHPIGTIAVLLVNSLVILPFLIIYQAEIYMGKYGLAD